MYEDSSWGSKIRKIHPFWGGIRIFRKISTTGTPAATRDFGFTPFLTKNVPKMLNFA